MFGKVSHSDTVYNWTLCTGIVILHEEKSTPVPRIVAWLEFVDHKWHFVKYVVVICLKETKHIVLHWRRWWTRAAATFLFEETLTRLKMWVCGLTRTSEYSSVPCAGFQAYIKTWCDEEGGGHFPPSHSLQHLVFISLTLSQVQLFWAKGAFFVFQTKLSRPTVVWILLFYSQIREH